MLLIIEGPDGAGKSTLIETMRRESNRSFAILRMSMYPRDTDEVAQYLRFIERHPPDLPLVLDRHPLISEPIYGPLLRGIDRTACFSFTTHFSRILPSHLRMIYCRPPNETIRANVEKNANEQLAGVVERAEKLATEYDIMIREPKVRSMIPITRYDYTQDKIENILGLINIFWSIHP